MSEKTLNLAQCKEYMKNIIELELSCYEQDKMLQSFTMRTKKIGPDLDKARRMATESHPGILEALFDVFESFRVLLVNLGIGVCGGFVVGFVREIVLYKDLGSSGVGPLPYLLWGAGIGVGITFLILFAYHLIDNKRLANYHNRELLSVYKDDLAMLETQSANLQDGITKLKASRAKTKELLIQYYALGFIYPKYHNLVAVATMYEYLDSQRCYSLIGPDGAYNLYESELRMNTIIGKLDDVISRLDDIAEGQQLLAQEIRQSNAKIDRLAITMDNIEGNTALTAYYSEITAKNTSYQLLYQGLIEMTR